MAYTPKPGSFSLFKNDRKEQDNHPDYKGDGADLDGNAVWVSAWIKRSDKGTFMSCSFKLKEEKPVAKPQLSTAERFVDDDIPF